MATKTLTIDLEAYRRLKGVQRENESFSQTIKRVVRPPFDFEAWLKELEAAPLSKQAFAAIEDQERRRHKPTNRRR